MRNKLKLSLIAIGMIANLPSNTNAQTFYQCMPCQAGTYYSNGSCAKCPAGTYSQETGATSSNTCRPCQDYQWSDAGSTYCNWVKITLWKADWDKKQQKLTYIAPGTFYTKDLYNMKYGCGCENFAGGCKNGNRNGDCGGVNGVHVWKDGDRINLDCKSFPCEVQNSRGFRIGEDGTVYNRLSADLPWSSLGYKATWDD